MKILDRAAVINHINDSDAIALDWDGTLVDAITPKLLHNQAIAKACGKLLAIEEVRSIWQNSSGFLQLMQNLTGLDDQNKIHEVISATHQPEFDKQLFDFSLLAIQSLKTYHKKLALITNLTPQYLADDADRLGIALDDFDFVQTPASNGAYAKPSIGAFQIMITEFRVPPSKVVYFGDEVKNDFQPANRLGINFIGVESGMSTRQEFTDAGASSIESLGQVIESK